MAEDLTGSYCPKKLSPADFFTAGALLRELRLADSRLGAGRSYPPKKPPADLLSAVADPARELSLARWYSADHKAVHYIIKSVEHSRQTGQE